VLNVYSDNKDLYTLFTLDETSKWLQNAPGLHICTAEQLEKSNHIAATPVALYIYLQGPPILQTCYERKGWGGGPVLTVHIQQLQHRASNTEPLLSLTTWKNSE